MPWCAFRKSCDSRTPHMKKNPCESLIIQAFMISRTDYQTRSKVASTNCMYYNIATCTIECLWLWLWLFVMGFGSALPPRPLFPYFLSFGLFFILSNLLHAIFMLWETNIHRRRGSVHSCWCIHRHAHLHNTYSYSCCLLQVMVSVCG